MQNVTLYKCLLISPGDVAPDREAVGKAIEQWNAHAGKSLGARIDLVRWEVHGVPDASAAPQTVINDQLVDDCDFGVALFWTRVGTPTEKFASGSIEEVERLRKRKARVLIYFKNAPLPHDVDAKGLEGLRSFKDQIKKEGLLGEYGTSDEIAALVERHLTSVVVESQAKGDAAPVPGKTENATLTAPRPDVRVSVSAVGLITEHKPLQGSYLVIRVTNHSPIRVFLSMVGLKYRSGTYGHLLIDPLTRSTVNRELDPGAKTEMHGLASSVLERKDDIVCAVCIDEIGREYQSKEDEMRKALVELER